MMAIRLVLAGCAAAAAMLAPVCAGAAAPADGAPNAVFAVVDGVAIGAGEFEGAMNAAINQKFYHRRPAEDQLAALRDEVTERMVNQVLLLKEARRRGLQPDEDKVRVEIDAYEKRFGSQPQWLQERAQVLPVLTRTLQDQSVIARLEAAARAVAPPAEDALRAYYESHPQSFTEPERLRLSTIVLKVDPSSPAAAWQQARERVQELLVQIANGADFADLARLYSGDPSGHDGGNMGYRHRGTLPPGVETIIDKMAVGALSEPIRLLEGMAILRLTERKPPQLRRLEEVRRNVTELWAREQGEKQWRDLLAQLRAVADIKVNPERRPGHFADGGAGSGPTAR